MINISQPLFSLGQIVATPGALRALAEVHQVAAPLLHKHVHGDWGDVCEEDKAANNHALSDGDRLLSSYRLQNNVKICIITEADRSVTTLLLPEEY